MTDDLIELIIHPELTQCVTLNVIIDIVPLL